MKKTLSTLLLALGTLMACAQNYTTTWPYYYNEFKDGTVYLESGSKTYYRMNIHLKKGTLHYVKDGMVLEAAVTGIRVIDFGKDRFIIANGDVMKVAAQNKKAVVADHVLLNMNSLQATSGAYGTSSTTTATRKLSSLHISDATGLRLIDIKTAGSEGQKMDVTHHLYLILKGKVYPANRKQIEERLPEEKREAFRAFVKKNRIRWKDPESLLTLANFFEED